MDRANFSAPIYNDNFGVKSATDPSNRIQSNDIVTESVNITYEAVDFEGNVETAIVVIQVIGKPRVFYL